MNQIARKTAVQSFAPPKVNAAQQQSQAQQPTQPSMPQSPSGGMGMGLSPVSTQADIYQGRGMARYGSDASAAPKEKTDLEKFQESQVDYANKFRERLPQMQNDMAHLLSQNENETTNQRIKQVKQNNSRRGMAYGGVNAGQQGLLRSEGSQQLARAISGANQDLQSASDLMQAQAIQTGMGLQNINQNIENQAYSRAMARMQADNSVAGGLLGSAATAGLLFL